MWNGLGWVKARQFLTLVNEREGKRDSAWLDLEEGDIFICLLGGELQLLLASIGSCLDQEPWKQERKECGCWLPHA